MRYFLVLVLTWMCVASAAAEDLKPVAERVAVSDFGLESLDGTEKRLEETKGKVVVLSFWATWCAPCLQELEHLNRFQQAYPDDLVVLAVSVDDAGTIANVRRVAKRNSWVMTVLLDQEGKVSAVLNPRGTNPFSIFLDRGGRVALSHEGYAPGDEVRYEDMLKALIAEPKP